MHLDADLTEYHNWVGRNILICMYADVPGVVLVMERVWGSPWFFTSVRTDLRSAPGLKRGCSRRSPAGGSREDATVALSSLAEKRISNRCQSGFRTSRAANERRGGWEGRPWKTPCFLRGDWLIKKVPFKKSLPANDGRGRQENASSYQSEQNSCRVKQHFIFLLMCWFLMDFIPVHWINVCLRRRVKPSRDGAPC